MQKIAETIMIKKSLMKIYTQGNCLETVAAHDIMNVNFFILSLDYTILLYFFSAA